MSHKRAFALLTPEIRSWKIAQMLQKPVFALPGCQRMSVNTLLCDTLGLAEFLAGLFLKKTSKSVKTFSTLLDNFVAQHQFCSPVWVAKLIMSRLSRGHSVQSMWNYTEMIR